MEEKNILCVCSLGTTKAEDTTLSIDLEWPVVMLLLGYNACKIIVNVL